VSKELLAWLQAPQQFVTQPSPSIAVDGLGADRVASLLDGTETWLRRAREEDARLWFRWATDPAVRANGFHPDPIPWETHEQWFNHHYQSANARLWLGFDLETRPLGYVRLHRRETGEWEVGVAVDAAHRGRGVGAKLVRLALQEFALENETSRGGEGSSPPSQRPVIVAKVRPANTASLHLFQTLGFVPDTSRSTPECCVLTCPNG
jgi:RimJ/RimL family protein N-acetyltransferase